MDKWWFWTVLMPYYTDAYNAYFMLNKFSRVSRKELANNFNAFNNSMHKYK